MPHRKDYLLDQLRDFFEALARVAGWIKDGELEKAELEINALASDTALGRLIALRPDVYDIELQEQLAQTMRTI